MSKNELSRDEVDRTDEAPVEDSESASQTADMALTDADAIAAAEAAEAQAAAEKAAAEEANAAALAKRETTVNRKWTFKLLVISALAIGFGGFFLYDGAIGYPKRGAEAAEFMEYTFLDGYDKQLGGISGYTGMDDPAEQRAKLDSLLKTKGQLDNVSQLQKMWLDNLALIHKLDKSATSIPRVNYKDAKEVKSAAQRLDDLRKAWTTNSGGNRKSPSPLSGFDIPSQWAAMTVCFVAGIWVLISWLRGRVKTYRWEPETQTLSLPSGESITPKDIAEVDRRKWDKLFVTLVIKADHASLAGKSLEFDLLRYEPLEAWILAMEKTAFPEAA